MAMMVHLVTSYFSASPTHQNTYWQLGTQRDHLRWDVAFWTQRQSPTDSTQVAWGTDWIKTFSRSFEKDIHIIVKLERLLNLLQPVFEAGSNFLARKDVVSTRHSSEYTLSVRLHGCVDHIIKLLHDPLYQLILENRYDFITSICICSLLRGNKALIRS